MPAGMVLTFKVEGDLEGKLRQLENALSPMVLMEFMDQKVQPLMRRRISARFMSEGDGASGKWMALQPATVQIRQDNGFPGEHPINQRTGELFDKLTRGANTIKPMAGGASFTLPGPVRGEMRDKLATAQGGRTNPQTPPRPILGLDVQDQITVMTALALHVETAVAVGGGLLGGAGALSVVA